MIHVTWDITIALVVYSYYQCFTNSPFWCDLWWMWHFVISCIKFHVMLQNINNLQHTLGSLLLKPGNMKLGYICILVLISVDFLWTSCGIPCNSRAQNDPACRRRCVYECNRTWDNGRKTCCEGQGPVERGGTWSQLCNSGRIDINAYVLWSKRIALLWGEAQLSLLKEK